MDISSDTSNDSIPRRPSLSIRTPRPDTDEEDYLLTSPISAISGTDSHKSSSSNSMYLPSPAPRNPLTPVMMATAGGAFLLIPFLIYGIAMSPDRIMIAIYTLLVEWYVADQLMYWTFDACEPSTNEVIDDYTRLILLDTLMAFCEVLWPIFLVGNPLVAIFAFVSKVVLGFTYRGFVVGMGDCGIVTWHIANSSRRAFLVGYMVCANL